MSSELAPNVACQQRSNNDPEALPQEMAIPPGIVRISPDDGRTPSTILLEMAIRGWALVRVLNLSDPRNANMDAFASLLDQFRHEYHEESHSIFSSVRKAELARQLVRATNARIIAAWGVTPTLESLAKMAQASLGRDIVGKPGAGRGWRFWHPLPRTADGQRDWLVTVDRLLADRDKKLSEQLPPGLNAA